VALEDPADREARPIASHGALRTSGTPDVVRDHAPELTLVGGNGRLHARPTRAGR
jgi:hypothetical protein